MVIGQKKLFSRLPCNQLSYIRKRGVYIEIKKGEKNKDGVYLFFFLPSPN